MLFDEFAQITQEQQCVRFTRFNEQFPFVLSVIEP